MRKFMIAAALVLGVSAAFAGDSDALKAVMKAKTYAEASQLLQGNLSSMASSAEKAKAYNKLATLALAEFNDKNLAMQTAAMTKQTFTKADSLAMYDAAYNATKAAVECAKYDNEPNEKGKVAPKFTKSLGPNVANARIQLLNAGQWAASNNDNENLVKYWGALTETHNNPLFESTKATEDPNAGLVAYYAAVYADRTGKTDLAEKYVAVAASDTAKIAGDAKAFQLTLAARGLKTQADSLAYVEKVKGMIEKDPTNEAAMQALSNMYYSMNKTTELLQLLDGMIQKNPDNYFGWAMKGQTLMNQEAKAEKPNWDEPINCYKHALKLQPDNVAVLTLTGAVLNQKASGIVNDKNAQTALYNEAKGYLEHAQQLDPNQEQAKWAYYLYSTYYQLNDPKAKEIESLLKK